MIKFPPSPLSTLRKTHKVQKDSDGLLGYPIFTKRMRRISESKAWNLLTEMHFTLAARAMCGRDLHHWYSYQRVISWMNDHDKDGNLIVHEDIGDIMASIIIHDLKRRSH